MIASATTLATHSGLVRDLLDDRFSDRSVVLAVTDRTRSVYDHLVSNCGATDQELEQCLLKALDLLTEKISALEQMRADLKRKR